SSARRSPASSRRRDRWWSRRASTRRSTPRSSDGRTLTMTGSDETVASILAARAVEARKDGLPDAARHAAVRTVVDWYGAAIAGSVLAPVPNLVRQFVATPSVGRSRVVGRD